MERLYIIDRENFRGSVENTMPFVEKNARNGIDILNHTYVHYTRETFKEYNQRHGNKLEALTWEEMEPLLKKYHDSLKGEWEEITEERYDELLNVLPPIRWRSLNGRFNVFFMMEATTANLHTCVVKDRGTTIEQERNPKYYTALREVNADNTTLLNDLNNSLNKK